MDSHTEKYLKNIVSIIDNEIKIVNEEISNENEKIKYTEQKLMKITGDIVKLKQDSNLLQNKMNELKAQKAKFQSTIHDLKKELDDKNIQMKLVYSDLEKQKRIVEDAYPFGFLVEGYLAIQNSLTNKYDNIRRESSELEFRYRQLYDLNIDSQRKYNYINENIQSTIKKQIELAIIRDHSEKELSSMGKLKTSYENFKSDINKFQIQCNGVLEKIKMNLDFDHLFNSTDEINKLISDIYSKYNRKMPPIIASNIIVGQIFTPIFNIYSKL